MGSSVYCDEGMVNVLMPRVLAGPILGLKFGLIGSVVRADELCKKLNYSIFVFILWAHVGILSRYALLIKFKVLFVFLRTR